MSKLDKMIKYVPDFYKPSTNPNINALLNSFATEDDTIATQVLAAKNQIFVQNAASKYLDLLGANVGVERNDVTDAIYRQLIPILSFYPKQIAITIQDLLDAFFGVGNPNTGVFETSPNEIVVKLPSTIPIAGLSGGTLKGSMYFKSYGGSIVSIDDTAPGKNITVDLTDLENSVGVDEWSLSKFGQESYSRTIISNTAGTTGIVVTFADADDLSVFTTTETFNVSNPKYQGSYVYDESGSYSITIDRGELGQIINISDTISVLTMSDASKIPDDSGKIVFGYGTTSEEGPIEYYGRPNDTTLFIDAGHSFVKTHAVGDTVNKIVEPSSIPQINGQDYAVYFSDVTASVILAKSLILDIVAAGVVVNFIEVTV